MISILLNVLFYTFIFLSVACAASRLFLSDILDSERNKKNWKKNYNYYKIVSILSWAFLLLGALMLIIGKAIGIFN